MGDPSCGRLQDVGTRRALITFGLLLCLAGVIVIPVLFVVGNEKNNDNDASSSANNRQVPSFAPTMLRKTTTQPTTSPTSELPSFVPTTYPSDFPTNIPSAKPSAMESSVPSTSQMPSITPSTSQIPSITPLPTIAITIKPSTIPSLVPTMSSNPSISKLPSSIPSVLPSMTPYPTEEVTVATIIRSVSLFNGDEFMFPNSYQFRSLRFLQKEGPLTLYTEKRWIQRYVLSCIYYSTFAENKAYNSDTTTLEEWTNSANWVTSSGTGSDGPTQSQSECTWFGITCNEEEEVTEIELSSNNIVGVFPPEVKLLSKSLTKLSLHDNSILNSNEEVEFLGELTQLTHLDVGMTYMDYIGIPTAMEKLSNLQYLDLSWSSFNGPLNGSIFTNMTNLVHLDLSGNKFNSPVPAQITSIPTLEHFSCLECGLEGDMEFIGNMTSIDKLWLGGNPNFGGEIPSTIGLVTSIAELSIQQCNFQGELPSELGLLTNIEKLWFGQNALTGLVPSEMGLLSFLDTLRLEENQIEGSVPFEVCSLAEEYSLATFLVDCQEIECKCCNNC